MTVLALLTAAVAAWQVAAHHGAAGPPPPDGIGPRLAAYRTVRRHLPASGRIGFLDTSPGSDLDVSNRYLAQHALAPLVVVNHAEEAHDFVLTGPEPPAGVAEDERLRGYVLVAAGDRNVLVFQRRAE